MFTINQNLIDDFADKINEKEKKSNKVTSLSSSSTDTQYPSAKCVYDTVDIVDDKVSVVYNPVSIIDTSDSVYDADRWTESGTMGISQQSGSKVIAGGGGGYVIYDGNISNLDNYDITLNLTPSKKNTHVFIYDNDIGTLPTSQTSILFKKRDGVVKVVYDNNQYDSSSVQIVSFYVSNKIRYTIDVVLYQGMIYDVIDSIPSKTSDLTNDSGFLTSHQDIIGKEDKSNKVTSLSSSSTDTEYPSAKAVFNSLPSVPSASSITPSADTTNGSVGDGTTWARSNHTHPKSSLYAEASHTHNNKEDVYNKVTSISSSSTDTQYPSAKAVYDATFNLDILDCINENFTLLSLPQITFTHNGKPFDGSTLHILEGYDKGAYVDWGDGTPIETYESTDTLKHSYSDSVQEHTITIYGDILNLYNNSFENFIRMTSINIPSGVTSLGDYCFNGCTSLTSVVIPSSVTILGNNCFYNCSSLTNVTIPSSVTSLGGNCFNGCTNLVDYQLYWETPPVHWYSISMPNNTDTYFTIPNGTTANYTAKGFPSDKLVERSE